MISGTVSRANIWSPNVFDLNRRAGFKSYIFCHAMQCIKINPSFTILLSYCSPVTVNFKRLSYLAPSSGICIVPPAPAICPPNDAYAARWRLIRQSLKIDSSNPGAATFALFAKLRKIDFRRLHPQV